MSFLAVSLVVVVFIRNSILIFDLSTVFWFFQGVHILVVRKSRLISEFGRVTVAIELG